MLTAIFPYAGITFPVRFNQPENLLADPPAFRTIGNALRLVQNFGPIS
jgi:hypothetical protein